MLSAKVWLSITNLWLLCAVAPKHPTPTELQRSFYLRIPDIYLSTTTWRVFHRHKSHPVPLFGSVSNSFSGLASLVPAQTSANVPV